MFIYKLTCMRLRFNVIRRFYVFSQCLLSSILPLSIQFITTWSLPLLILNSSPKLHKTSRGWAFEVVAKPRICLISSILLNYYFPFFELLHTVGSFAAQLFRSNKIVYLNRKFVYAFLLFFTECGDSKEFCIKEPERHLREHKGSHWVGT